MVNKWFRKGDFVITDNWEEEKEKFGMLPFMAIVASCEYETVYKELVIHPICVVNRHGHFNVIHERRDTRKADDLRIMNPEEKEHLLSVINDNGYFWSEEEMDVIAKSESSGEDEEVYYIPVFDPFKNDFRVTMCTSVDADDRKYVFDTASEAAEVACKLNEKFKDKMAERAEALHTADMIQLFMYDEDNWNI